VGCGGGGGTTSGVIPVTTVTSVETASPMPDITPTPAATQINSSPVPSLSPTQIESFTPTPVPTSVSTSVPVPVEPTKSVPSNPSNPSNPTLPTAVIPPTPVVAPTTAPSSSTIPVPAGYQSLPLTVSGGNLQMSWNNSSNAREACLILIYHSLAPSDTANPLPINCTFDNPNRPSRGSSVIYMNRNNINLRASSNPYGDYYINHLNKLKRDFEFLKTMFYRGKYPRELTSSELRAKGKIDVSGRLVGSAIGDTKDFTVYYSTYSNQKKNCECYAVGEHCYVYINKENISTYFDNPSSYASALAAYFDGTIYPLVHQYIGTEWSPGIDGDSHVYIVLVPGLNNAYFSFTDEYKQSDLPSGEISNEAEVLYIDPMLFSSSGKADSKIALIQSVAGHEFAHMVRFNMKFVGSGTKPVDFNTMASYFSTELSLHEGTSQFTENILLRRGISDNYTSIAAMRASGIGYYLDIPELCSLTSAQFNYNITGGEGIYEMGFFILQYLYEKKGYDAVTKLNKADGKMGLDSLYEAAGGRAEFENIFDKQSLSLLMSGRISDGNYSFQGIDLSGTTSYGGIRLHNVWSAFSNTGDYNQGIDITTLASDSVSTELYEWSPMFMKFYNLTGSLNVTINGLSPGSGGGSVKAYFIYK
ncbi:MAG: hypothetical protein ABRQ39_12345, partial [Candidatus Eremiobacterota bacterium]